MPLTRFFSIFILLATMSCSGVDLFGPEDPEPGTIEFEWYDADDDPNDVVMVLSKGERVTSNRGKGNAIIWMPDETQVDSIIVGVRLEEFDNSRDPNFYNIALVGGNNPVDWVNLYDGVFTPGSFEAIREQPITYGWSNQNELWGREICVQRVTGNYIGIGLRFN